MPLSHDARVAVAGAGCIALILAGGKGVPRWRHWHSTIEQRHTDARARLLRAQQLVAESRSTHEALDREIGSYFSLAPAFFKGRSPNEGAADLAALVSDAADDNAVHLASLQPRADSVQGSLLVPVTVTVSATGDSRGVTGLLAELESGAPLVEVRDVTISQPDPAAPADHMEALHMDLTIRGLFRRTPDADQ